VHLVGFYYENYSIIQKIRTKCKIKYLSIYVYKYTEILSLDTVKLYLRNGVHSILTDPYKIKKKT